MVVFLDAVSQCDIRQLGCNLLESLYIYRDQPSLKSGSTKPANAYISQKLFPLQAEYRNTYSQHMKKKSFFPLAISGKPVWAKQKAYIIIALHFFPPIHKCQMKISKLSLSIILPPNLRASSLCKCFKHLKVLLFKQQKLVVTNCVKVSVA